MKKVFVEDVALIDNTVDSEEVILMLEDGLPILPVPSLEKMGEVADAMLASAMTNVYALSRNSRDIKTHLDVGKFAMMAGKYAIEKELAVRKDEVPDASTLENIWKIRSEVDEATNKIDPFG
jgi:hypothetical protein